MCHRDMDYLLVYLLCYKSAQPALACCKAASSDSMLLVHRPH